MTINVRKTDDGFCCTECDCTYPPHCCPDCGVATAHGDADIERAARAGYEAASPGYRWDDEMLGEVDRDAWRRAAVAVASALKGEGR